MTHAAFTPVVNAFRFYEDGLEASSTPIDAQDTNIVRNLDNDSQIQVRFRIDETGGADGAATDDYALEYAKNSGSFAAVTSTNNDVTPDIGSSLTDGGATSNRASNGISDPGAGAFVAGEQEADNGAIEDLQLTLNNFTEVVFAVVVLADGVVDSDFFDFRLTLNGGTPGMTNNVTPRITVQKTPPSIPDVNMAPRIPV